MVEKILNNTTPYGKIRASREGSLHSSTLIYSKSFHMDRLTCKFDTDFDLSDKFSLFLLKFSF